ncbi:hypothetical protein SAMN02745945_02183 [Peptoclostridium litorale DSM 5388]|uniref:Uncharacterized protein n=1 Tax=Peptoclostridium litorale DSM 5388 TaxID=1121324 RepID=A0A069RFL0_PEPLI|nr:hypothetical protein [Peptoclostridium litorale]KDR95801.1 hypothetical protein CLIT_10c05290 [Peptoclostridium litorale DSM 5388]SIO21037.1 hypothetical protein SAMN02745945_02183 [Peptoclostridium litorale DSM 5388]
MKDKKRLWVSVIVISTFLLMAFSFYSYSNFLRGPLRKGMWPAWYSSYQSDSGILMSIEEIKREVDRYIADFEEELEIADIFVYEDSDYYVSIEEAATGKGAFELLVNQYSGVIYPEHGPNMMWNEKYGMHGRGHIMGRHMRSRSFFNEYSGYYRNEDATKQISLELAVELATEYVKKYVDEDMVATEEGHEFYGYYTLHIKKEEQTVGMLSVNYYTGDVWFHDWHGKLIEVISHHED